MGSKISVAEKNGQIERRQAVTLLVLGDLGGYGMGLWADDDRDGFEPSSFRRTQAPRAGWGWRSRSHT